MRLDLGPHEPRVRWIETAASSGFREEAARRVAARRGEADGLLLAGALAAARGVDPARAPAWLLLFTSAQSCLLESGADEKKAPTRDPESVILPVTRFLLHVRENLERHPFSLPDIASPAEGAKEEFTFELLEAVRRGDAAAADRYFIALAADLGREEAGDLLFSAGLEGLTGPRDTLLAPVEALSALQHVGWEWGPTLLRPVVCQQTAGGRDASTYDQACREIADRHLLRRVRRRTPGAPSLGETAPAGFLGRAMEWGRGDPLARTHQMADMLAQGISLEDAAEIVSLGSSLLFVQEGLRQTPWTAASVEDRVSVVAAARAVRRLLHLGTPGQRILALLLAGSHPGVRDVRLRPEAPECGWWISPATRWTEPAASGLEAGEAAGGSDSSVAWAAALNERRTNALLPIVEAVLESGRPVGALRTPVAEMARRQEAGAGYAIALERVLADAYEATRAPHRWIHVWASGLAQTLWPEADSGERIGGLHGAEKLC